MPAPPLSYDEADAATLRTWVENAAPNTAVARRARIVLLSLDGHGTAAIADELRCSKQTVTTWRERYRTHGIAGLADAPRSGRPVTVNPAAVVLRTLDPPPTGAARWTTRLLAADLGISNVAVATVWRAWGMVPARNAVAIATEPALAGPVTGVAGLHVDPTVRLLAVQVGPPRKAAPVPDRSDATTATTTPMVLTAFLDHLATMASADLRRTIRDEHPIRLLAEGTIDPVRRWARTCPGVALHTVPTHLSWERLARVACLAAREPGASTVAGLLDAVEERAGVDPVSWLAG